MRTTAPAPLRIRILMGGRVSLWNTPNLSYIVKTFSCVCTCVFMHVLWFYANSSICAFNCSDYLELWMCVWIRLLAGLLFAEAAVLSLWEHEQSCRFKNSWTAKAQKSWSAQHTLHNTDFSFYKPLSHTPTHTPTHARTHARTHTHTHTHVGFYGLRGLSIGVMVFILYKLYVLLPYTYPTPKLSPHRRRLHFYFPPKKLSLYDL